MFRSQSWTFGSFLHPTYGRFAFGASITNQLQWFALTPVADFRNGQRRLVAMVANGGGIPNSGMRDCMIAGHFRLTSERSTSPFLADEYEKSPLRRRVHGHDRWRGQCQASGLFWRCELSQRDALRTSTW